MKLIVSFRLASPRFTYTLFYLSAHVVNRLLRENWNTIPKFLSGKILLKNVTVQILNFTPVSSLIKISPYGVRLNCLCFFLLFNAVKTDTKLTLHHMGTIFII